MTTITSTDVKLFLQKEYGLSTIKNGFPNGKEGSSLTYSRFDQEFDKILKEMNISGEMELVCLCSVLVCRYFSSKPSPMCVTIQTENFIDFEWIIKEFPKTRIINADDPAEVYYPGERIQTGNTLQIVWEKIME